jgi:hypothetical protein
MKEIYQKRLHELVVDLMEVKTDDPDFELYKNTVSLIYTIVDDIAQLDRLDLALRQAFSEYYSTPIPIVICDN